MSEATVSGTQQQQSERSLRAHYEALLWKTMDILGVTASIERKVLAAVLIQFGVTLAIFLASFVLSGTIWILVSAFLFVGAIVAMGNTVLTVRRDFTTPIQRLEARHRPPRRSSRWSTRLRASARRRPRSPKLSPLPPRNRQPRFQT